MKKVLTAFTEQVIQFDTRLEYDQYIDRLMQSGKLFKIVDQKEDAEHKWFVTIRKQYNNNMFPID